MAAPTGGTPPSGAPTGGTSAPLEGISKGLSKAEEIAGKAKEVKDKAEQIKGEVEQVENTIDELTPDEEPEDEAATEEPPEQPLSTPSEPIYVNYSDTWEAEPPPPPQRTVVVTRVVHQPQRPPPPIPEEPVPEPEPRARGFVGLSLRGTTTNYNPSALTGARAGFTFRDRFTIGGAFYSLTARYAGSIVGPDGRELGLRMSYGGLMLGWRIYSGRVVQLGLETLAGAGAACVSRSKKSVGRARCIEKVGLVSIEPGVELAFVVTDWARLGFTGGYRFITREAWRPPNDFTLSGPYVGLNLDFGPFRSRR